MYLCFKSSKLIIRNCNKTFISRTHFSVLPEHSAIFLPQAYYVHYTCNIFCKRECKIMILFYNSSVLA